MNRLTWIVGGLILIAAIFGAYYVIQQSRQPVPAPSGTGNAAVGANGASSVITYSDKGFSPTTLSIARGTTVTWVNQSSHAMWVQGTASGVCTSSNSQETFNECQTISEGGSYSYTFTRIGTFPYANHTQAADKGEITVSEASVSGPINPNAIPE